MMNGSLTKKILGNSRLFFFLLMVCFIGNGILVLINDILFKNYDTKIFTYIWWFALMLPLFILSIPHILINIKPVDFLFVLLWILVPYLCTLSNPFEHGAFMFYLPTVFFSFLPLYFGFRFFPFDKQTKRLGSIVLPIFIVLLSFTSAFRLITKQASAAMVFSYRLLLILQIYLSFCTDASGNIVKSPIVALISIIGAIGVLSGGERGPIIILFLSFIFFLFRGSLTRPKDFFLKSFCFILAFMGIFGCLYFLGFFVQIGLILKNAGINGRIADLLIGGGATSQSNWLRITKYMAAFETALRNPLFGNGIFGEYEYLDVYANAGLSLYCHNLLLSMLASFGILFGIPITFFLTASPYFILKMRYLRSDYKMMFLMIYLSSIFSLWFSGSLYSTETVLAFFGFAITCISKNLFGKMEASKIPGDDRVERPLILTAKTVLASTHESMQGNYHLKLDCEETLMPKNRLHKILLTFFLLKTAVFSETTLKLGPITALEEYYTRLNGDGLAVPKQTIKISKIRI